MNPGPGASSSDRRPPGWFSRAAFWVFWVTFGLVLRVWFRLGVENRPKLKGPYVLAPNHSSFLDPLVVGAMSTRRIGFMMTSLIYRSPWTGWFYRWNRAIPVAPTGGNRDALRAARGVLRDGGVLGIFPEGGISRDGQLMLGNPGAVSLVLAEKVPVIPVGVVGAGRAMGYGMGWPRPRKVKICFGEPIPPDEIEALASDRKVRLEKATALIMARIGELVGQPSRERVLAEGRSASPEPVGLAVADKNS